MFIIGYRETETYFIVIIGILIKLLLDFLHNFINMYPLIGPTTGSIFNPELELDRE